MIENTLAIMATIKHDSLLHFFYGSIVLFVLSRVTRKYAVVLTVIVAVSKELYDPYLTFSDILWTLLPCLLLIRSGNE